MDLLPRGWRLRRAARRHFGWGSLRAGQLPAMKALLGGRDALVVLPTGAGKSAVYQVTGAVLDGPTVVVSPLLALQQDQIAGLNGRADERVAAVRVSSAQTPNQQRAALAALRAGTGRDGKAGGGAKARFLFMTPEQLGTPERLAEVRALRPALVAVDEAHCVSAWGYDFRPDYLQLGHLIRELGRPPVVALTATASPPVRADIADVLGLRDPYLVVAGLDRPNLRLAALRCTGEEQRWQRLLARVREEEPPGIVYAPTRAATEELTERLRAAGVEAAAFHAGLSTGERDRRYTDFMADRVPVMVATSAFGMGVDKPNIRWVFHTALPDSPDSYLQEIGRAGRDGAPARTLLLFRPEDVALQRYFTGGAPRRVDLTALAAALGEGPVTRSALAERAGLPARRLTHLLTLLEQVGAAQAGKGGRWSAPRYAPPPAQAAELALAQVERQQTVRRSRIDMMLRYAESGACRGRTLLGYFGEQLDVACGHCDNCEAGTASRGPRRRARAVVPRQAAPPVAEARTGDQRPFPVSSAVRHPEWGAGTIMAYEQDRVVVLFDEVGYKTLSVPVVRQRGLLTAE
jgi:ATP-dependent DNA helicase RecQ